MPAIIGCVSQKGGQGKDATARGIAVEAARCGLVVDVVDMDVAQASTMDWAQDRKDAGLLPAINVRLANTLTEALDDVAPEVDLVIVIGPARADAITLELASRADLIVQPIGASRDDLRPAVRAFNSLANQGIPRSRLLMALNRLGSDAEADEVRHYVSSAGYGVANGYVPEKISYRRTQNAGLAISEIRHPRLKAAACAVIQSIIDTAVAAANQTEEAA